jgi:hypothetical protein
VIPAVLLTELIAAFPKVPRWLIWSFRLAVVAGIARVLLHGSSYLTNVGEPDSGAWSALQAWLILVGLAALQGTVWAVLTLAARRGSLC